MAHKEAPDLRRLAAAIICIAVGIGSSRRKGQPKFARLQGHILGARRRGQLDVLKHVLDDARQDGLHAPWIGGQKQVERLTDGPPHRVGAAVDGCAAGEGGEKVS